MEEAAGSADAEMEKIKNSIQYKVNALQQTWVGIAQDLIDRGTIGNIVDGLTKISEAIGFITDKVGLLGIAFGGLFGTIEAKTGSITNFFKGMFNSSVIKLSEDDYKAVSNYFNEIAKGSSEIDAFNNYLSNVSLNTQNLARSAQSAGKDISAFTVKINLAKLAMNAFKIALSATIGLFISWGIQKLINHLETINVTTQDIASELNEINSELSTLNKELDELKKKEELSNSEKERLEYLEERIRLEEELKQYKEQEKNTESIGNFNKFTDYFDKTSSVRKYVDEFGATYANDSIAGGAGYALTHIGKILLMNSDLGNYDKLQSDALIAKDKIIQLQEEIKNTQDIINEIERNPNGDLAKLFNVDSLKSSLTESKDKLKNLTDDLNNSDGAIFNLKMTYDTYLLEICNLKDLINDPKTTESAKKQAEIMIRTYETASTILKSLINSFAILLKDDSLLIESNSEKLSRFTGISEEYLKSNFTDEELSILLTGSYNGDETIEQLKENLKNLQEQADENPIYINGKFNAFTDTQKEKMQTFRTDAGKLGEYLDAYNNGEDINYDELLSDFPELEGHVNDLGDAIQSLINQKLQSLFTTLGDIPEEAKKSLNDYADEVSNKAPKISEAFEDVSKTYDIVQETIQAINKNGFTDDILNNIAGINERMNTLVAGYYTGYVTESEIFEALQEEYQNDLDAYGKAILSKNIMNSDFYSSVVSSNDEFINDFKETYGLDLRMYSTYMDAKSAIARRYSMGLYSQFYDLENNALTSYGQGLYDAYNQMDSITKQSFLNVNKDFASFLSNYTSMLTAYDELDNFTFNKISDLFENSKFTGSLNSAKSAVGDFFDFFERRIDIIDKALSKLDTDMENVNGATAKNMLVDAKSSLVSTKISDYSSAIAMYQSQMDKALAKIPEEYRNRAINGGLSLVDFGDDESEIKAKIDDYIKWSDKVKDCKEQIAQLTEELRQLALTKFNNIADEFEERFNIFDSGKSMIDKQISLFEESGQVIGEGFYQSQKEMSQKQLGILEEEKSALVESLKSSLASGAIQQGTDEWLEMMKKINDVEGSILDAKTAIEKFDNAILQVHDEMFQRIQTRISNITDEMSNLIGLISDADVSSKSGSWTKEGLAQMGLYAQQYEAAIYQVEQYNEELERLDQLYAEGKYSTTEYLEKYAELTSAQWEAVNASESARKSIIEVNKARIELVKEGIQEEIDAYTKLINKQKESLENEKEAHDYQKSISEKTTSISKIENQIALLQNDTSASGIAKRKKLEQELSDARKELQEAEYEHSIDARKDALDKQLEDFEESKENEIKLLEESLKDEETIFKNSLDAIKNNSQKIFDEITKLATDHNIKVSSSITDAWRQGENAIARYKNTLSTNASAFINTLRGIETEEQNIQIEADTISIKLGEVFSMSSEKLDESLVTAYLSADNLRLASDLAHQSLLNTLNYDYNIEKLTSGVRGLTGALEEMIKKLQQAGDDLRSYQRIAVDMANGDKLIYDGNGNYKGKKSDLEKSNPAELLGLIGMSQDQYNHYLKSLPKHAKGVRNLKNNELAWTQEYGNELILSPTRNSVLTPLSKGDTVLTKEQTDNMYEWGKLSPDQFASRMSRISLLNLTPIGNGAELSIGNVITINGNIDNNNIAEMKQVATSAINEAFKKFSDELKYGKR